MIVIQNYLCLFQFYYVFVYGNFIIITNIGYSRKL